VQKEKKHLEVMAEMQAEVREMVRLSKGGKSFLESAFHSEMTGEASEEQKKIRREAEIEAREMMQI